MSRALIIVSGDADRRKAATWCQKAPVGTRIEFRGAKRTTDQNDKLWAMLTDVSRQAVHNGVRYVPDEWKVIFMHACGREVQFIPSLDGKTFLPWGQSSSKLSKDEMSELIDFIAAWGAENGVTFHDTPTADDSPASASAQGGGDDEPTIVAVIRFAFAECTTEEQLKAAREKNAKSVNSAGGDVIRIAKQLYHDRLDEIREVTG